MRLGNITGSRLGAIMPGVKGKYLAARATYMEELVAEILTGETAPTFMNSAMEHGVNTEPLAIGAYEANSGVFTQEVGICTHPTIEGFMASPDALVGEDGCLEIKSPNTTTHLKTMSTGKVKRDYEWQVYAEMICAERKWCDFVSYDPRLPEVSSYFTKRYTLTESIKTQIETEVKKFLAELKEMVEELNGRSNSNKR